MAKQEHDEARAGWWPGALIWLGGVLLLVPEAPLIAALVCVYLVLGGLPLVGLLVALLIIGFMARAAALHLARIALEQGRTSAAGALVQVALALYPWSADGLALQGALALASGEPELAAARLRRAIALLPGQASFYAALSGALLELGRPSEAAAAARQALALDERCAIAHLHLAEADQALGAPATTIEDRLRAGLVVATDPATEATIRCALAGHLLGEQRFAEATLTLHGAEALLPRCQAGYQAALRLRLAELLLAQGQTERAREYFGIVALDPQRLYVGPTPRP